MQKQQAFIQFVKDNEGIIYKVARVYAADTEDLQDLYQEIVYQLWKSFDSFRGESKRSTWMYRIALNTSITHHKKGQKRKEDAGLDFLDFDFTEEASDDHARISLMYAQIKQLNAVEKGLILLFLEGKSYEEIGGITGFTTSNVGTRLSRIKQKLKAQIQKQEAVWN